MIRAMPDGGGGVRRPKAPVRPKSATNPTTQVRVGGGGAGLVNRDLGQWMAKNSTSTPPPAGNTPPNAGGSTYTAPGGGGGSFYGGGDTGLSPMVTSPTEEDYLAGDSGYTAELSALQGALQRFLADSDFQRSNYTTDYQRSLRDLGYDEGAKQWNFDDPLTASGRGYNNQLNDFASRGMLQSQGYADAYNELLRMLGQQYDTISTGKNTFMTDMDNQTANFKAENTANQQAARAQALQRRAAQFAL